MQVRSHPVIELITVLELLLPYRASACMFCLLFLLQRLIVCLEESLYIHNIRDMKVLHTIRDTPSNPEGICALSTHNDNCYLAYPGSNQTGEVQIFDAVNLVSSNSISKTVSGSRSSVKLRHL